MSNEFRIEPHDANCIRLVQITDTHIFADDSARFDGVDTGQSLADVIAQVNKEQHAADLVVVTGDLVDDAHVVAYEKLHGHLLDLKLPVFCLPGNHDDAGLMHTLLNRDNVQTSKLIKVGAWRVVLLDSCLDNSHSGELKAQELAYLEHSLIEAEGKFVLICLHHPPVSVASQWMDAMMLRNPDALFSVVDRYRTVRALVWGHIHQVFRKKRKQVQLYGSPSSCVQFKPGSSEYIRDEFGPAYSVLQLYDDGRVVINVHRL
jgi:3',5'-cyclic-AMP phosphodiesterase